MPTGCMRPGRGIRQAHTTVHTTVSRQSCLGSGSHFVGHLGGAWGSAVGEYAAAAVSDGARLHAGTRVKWDAMFASPASLLHHGH